MKTKPSALLTLILGIACTLHAAALTPPAQFHPPDGAVLTQSIPHFEWQRSEVLNPEAVGDSEIQIARDEEGQDVFDRDRLAGVIGWYVPDRELPPGNYTWRIAAVDAEGKPGTWSPKRKFEVRRPERALLVPQGADFQAIRRVIAEAAKQTPAVVKFAAGDYRLDPGELRHFIDIANVNDLEIDGGGATVVFTKPVGLIQLEHCNRVQVKNFTFDFDPPAYTAGRVLAVDAQAGTIEAEILPGHSLPDSLPAFGRDKKGMLVSESEGYAMKRGVPLVVPHDGCEPIEGRRYRFRFEKAAVQAFAVGDVYVLGPRWLGEGGGHGTAVNGGEDVVFFNLTIRSAANECLGSFYANRHAILHVRLERSSGQALSVNNGGNNHHNARTGPWIEGCLFENCGDDVCHVNGYAMSVASQPKPDRLRINYAQLYDLFGSQAKLDFRVGDRIQFYDEGQGRVLAERRVVEAVPEEKTLQVRLDGPVEGLTTGRFMTNKNAGYAVMDDVSVTQVFNASRMCNQFVFRHNVARNSRRVGVLAKGDGGLIEGNTFENLGGGGVEFWNAPFEGLAAENYVVRDNRIFNCGRIARKHAGIWATMFKTGGDKLHRNLLFERNEITGFPGSAILLADVENVVLRENRILAPPSKSEAIVLNNSAKVQLTGNAIQRLPTAQPAAAEKGGPKPPAH